VVDSGGTSGWRGGLRVGIGLGASTFALAISFGALAHAQGWDPLLTTVFSLVAFSGSAQFAVLTTFAGGGGLAAIGSATLMNARFLPMGSAAAASLEGGRLRRALEGQAVVDASWVAAYEGEGRFDRAKLMAATAVQWPAWVIGTAIGAYVGMSTDFLDRWGLDVIFPAFFLMLLFDSVRENSGARLVATAAALVGAGMVYVAPPGVALLASSAAAMVILLGPSKAATS